MGAVVYDVTDYAQTRGSGAGQIVGKLITSGAHTSSTSASDITDGAAGAGSAISVPRGSVLTIQCDEAARLAFGGTAATATAGHIVYAGETRSIEVPATGAISIIDLA